MRSAFVLAVLAAGALGLGACKGDRGKCETACRNYGTLLYWDISDKEIEKAPPGEREALRKKKLAEFSSQLENGVDVCINQCSSANNDKQIDCMIAAKTAAEATKCTK
jgi:hypothetical protein